MTAPTLIHPREVLAAVDALPPADRLGCYRGVHRIVEVEGRCVVDGLPVIRRHDRTRRGRVLWRHDPDAIRRLVREARS